MGIFYLQAYKSLEYESKLVISEMLSYHKNNPDQRFSDQSEGIRFKSGLLTFQIVNKTSLSKYALQKESMVFTYYNQIPDKPIFLSETTNYEYLNRFVGIISLNDEHWLVISKANTIPKFLSYFNTILLYLLITMILIMFLFGYLISSRMLKRVSYIDRAAKDIMQGDMSRRIIVSKSNKDEINELSITLNEMLNKINELMQQTMQVNHNIAHDLKSPLNRLKSRLEVTLLNTRDIDEYKSVINKSIEDLDYLIQTFNALLLIGNLNSGARNYQFKIVNISELLADVIEMYEIIAEDSGHQIINEVGDNILVQGNKNLLAQAFSNLIENAIKYTPEKSKIIIKTENNQNFIDILIIDNGAGIPTEMHDKVFEQFYRLDSSRSLLGTGLGLSLVKSIINIHKSKIKLENNQPKGLIVRISMLRNYLS